jgi:hypothetical protein
VKRKTRKSWSDNKPRLQCTVPGCKTTCESKFALKQHKRLLHAKGTRQRPAC